MIKNPINLNKQKLFTIALSVIFTMIFVYMGVKAVGSRLESTYLLVDGSGNFNGGLDVNGGINVPNINNKKFTVDSSGLIKSLEGINVNDKFSVDTNGNVKIGPFNLSVKNSCAAISRIGPSKGDSKTFNYIDSSCTAEAGASCSIAHIAWPFINNSCMKLPAIPTGCTCSVNKATNFYCKVSCTCTNSSVPEWLCVE